MSPTKRPYHEIPNPQILDAARQFRDGFCLMIRQPPYSGVLLPALHCASIALELYLKALSAHEIEVADPAPTGGGYVYAQSASKCHRLEDLFDKAPTDIQDLMETAAGNMPHLSGFSGVRKALEAHNPMFIASRYPFEPNSELSDVKIQALDELVGLLDDVTRKAPHRWVPDTP